MLKRLLPLAYLLAAASCPQLASAQTQYKSTMPDGKIIYGDKPVPGAKKVDPIKVPTTSGITPPSAKEGQVLRQLEEGRSARDAREQKIIAAEQKVSQAEAALATGKEPLPGERIGTAGGSSRLTDGYYARIKQLEDDVARTRADLAAARASDPVAAKNKTKETDVPSTGISQRALRDK